VTTYDGAGQDLLTVRDLVVEFPVKAGRLRAVDRVSLRVKRGEIVGVVGESGSGKTVLMLAILGLVPAPGQIVSGEVRLGDTDLRRCGAKALREVRGGRVTLVPPEAAAALNPVVRVGRQAEEGLEAHARGLDRRARSRTVIDTLKRCGLHNPEMRVRRYPHELSGGMQQRVAIAMGVQTAPELVIADEPTTALDVTVQAQVLHLLRNIKQSSGTSILFISHDITVVSELCDRVMVMYAGKVVEEGAVADVCRRPAHPYTKALLESIPPLGGEPPSRLTAIPGWLPSAPPWPAGCRFAARCALRSKLGEPARCTEESPEVIQHAGNRRSACHFADVALGAAS
jgi:oligopeptide/dipeptide ABC transporter ATP-binding protein